MIKPHQLAKIFKDVQTAKADLKRIQNAPPPIVPGRDESVYLRIFAHIVHNMELEAIRILRESDSALDQIQ